MDHTLKLDIRHLIVKSYTLMTKLDIHWISVKALQTLDVTSVLN